MTSEFHARHYGDNSLTAAPLDLLRIRVSGLEFIARWELKAAPRTCQLFYELLPLHMKLLHCCWSGEGGWIPLGRWNAPWYAENQTSHPKPGQLLLYASRPSEPELLIPYGSCVFNSKLGMLRGNHILTVTDGKDQLSELRHSLLWQGAQDCSIDQLVEA
jgi:hypothetical protein